MSLHVNFDLSCYWFPKIASGDITHTWALVNKNDCVLYLPMSLTKEVTRILCKSIFHIMSFTVYTHMMFRSYSHYNWCYTTVAKSINSYCSKIFPDMQWTSHIGACAYCLRLSKTVLNIHMSFRGIYLTCIFTYKCSDLYVTDTDTATKRIHT